jgi:iron(III) transport system substrate-binding protein
MRVRSLVALLAGVMTILFIIPSPRGVPAAEAPEVNVYSIWPEPYIAPLFEQFTRETNIRTKWIRQSSGQILAKVLAEKANPQADVMFGGPAETFIPAIEAGVLEPYPAPSAAGIPAAYKDSRSYWLGLARDPLVFMTNTNFLKTHGLKPPTSWVDLLNPVYKGQIQFANPQASGTGVARVATLVLLMGEDKAFAYMKALDKNVEVYTEHGAGGAIPIAIGQAATGTFFIVDALDIVDKGYPVVVTFPKEGTSETVEAVALIKGAKNPERGKRLIDWAVSDKMQSLYSKLRINFLPTSSRVEVPATVRLTLKQAKFITYDLQWVGQNRKRLVERFVREILSVR